MHTIELMSVVIISVTIVYIACFIIKYGQKYIRIYARNKILKFTQEEVKEKRKEIDEILVKTEEQKVVMHPYEIVIIT